MSDTVPEITVAELKARIDRGERPTIIDVREPHEWEIANLNTHGAAIIPLGEVPDRMGEIPRDREVIVHCRSGKRSGKAIEYLQTQGYDRLLNLQGGILAWADEVDPSMQKY